MRNLKIKIEYKGTNYCGWQTQKNNRNTRLQTLQRKSIQEIIEEILQKILQEKVKLISSGRTDAGVHALGQVANFKTTSNIIPKRLQKSLNDLLPEDIVVSSVEEVGGDFHSRFNAKSKVYRYTILNRNYPSVFLKDTVYFYPYPLDIRLMRKESRVLIGRHDFKSFQASGKKEIDTIRTIKKIKILKNKDLIFVDIEGNGFLHNMVRSIVGTLLEIGRGRLRRGSLKKILLSRDRKAAGPTLPARGLCLVKVNY